MITGSQIRSARHAIKLSVEQLVQKSSVSARAIKRMKADNGILNSTFPHLNAIQSALEAAGIEFIGSPDDRPGIRIRSLDRNS